MSGRNGNGKRNETTDDTTNQPKKVKKVTKQPTQSLMETDQTTQRRSKRKQNVAPLLNDNEYETLESNVKIAKLLKDAGFDETECIFMESIHASTNNNLMNITYKSSTKNSIEIYKDSDQKIKIRFEKPSFKPSVDTLDSKEILFLFEGLHGELMGKSPKTKQEIFDIYKKLETIFAAFDCQLKIVDKKKLEITPIKNSSITSSKPKPQPHKLTNAIGQLTDAQLIKGAQQQLDIIIKTLIAREFVFSFKDIEKYIDIEKIDKFNAKEINNTQDSIKILKNSNKSFINFSNRLQEIFVPPKVHGDYQFDDIEYFIESLDKIDNITEIFENLNIEDLIKQEQEYQQKTLNFFINTFKTTKKISVDDVKPINDIYNAVVLAVTKHLEIKNKITSEQKIRYQANVEQLTTQLNSLKVKNSSQGTGTTRFPKFNFKIVI